MNTNQFSNPEQTRANKPLNQTGPDTSSGGGSGMFSQLRRMKLLLAVVIFVLPLALIVFSIIIPVMRYKPIPWSGMKQAETAAASISLNSEQKASLKKIIELENEKAYRNNRLELANHDSIYLVLDLADSVVNLEIKGVTVRSNKIVDMVVSNRFGLISHENLLPWITEPFTLVHAISTIPKSPIVIKQAPKDTIEAAKTATTPEPPKVTAVYFTFYFDRNLVLEFEQKDAPNEEALDEIKAYRAQKKKENSKSLLRTLKSASEPDQPMTIKLIVNEADAKAIYRAVPTKTRLALKL